MALNSGGMDSFLNGMGSSFPQQDVVVVHKPASEEESRAEVRAHVQSSKAFFDLDAPVFVGDHIELDDPRGGTRTLIVESVKIHDVRGTAGFDGMSHLEVAFTE